jgi:HD-GYP domain-containing protein (c-di-GMP phosphodiesterase class II)
MVEKIVNMYDLIFCITNTGDLINNEITNHHRQVSYLAYRIAESYGVSKEEQRELFLAGLLHDVGAFSLKDRLELVDNEDVPTVHNHAYIGAGILEGFAPLKNVAKIIRYHHVPWEDGKGSFFKGAEVPILSHILHLADRIAVLINKKEDVIGQIKHISQKIEERSGSIFCPEMVEAFLNICNREYIWLDTVYEPLMSIMPRLMNFESLELNMKDAIQLSKIFASIIDFRSPFTANHSSGVAAVAEKLAQLSGFSENECKAMRIAGYLHDLGKLTISNDILEKAGPLDREEFNAIRSHTFYTYRTLQVIKNFETINTWASLHHERLDGRGYPFHLCSEEIPLGARVMAVADVFTAITEDRPYRMGMDRDQAKKVISNMVETGGLCTYVVDILMDNFEELNDIRKRAQSSSKRQYKKLQEINII